LKEKSSQRADAFVRVMAKRHRFSDFPALAANLLITAGHERVHIQQPKRRTHWYLRENFWNAVLFGLSDSRALRRRRHCSRDLSEGTHAFLGAGSSHHSFKQGRTERKKNQTYLFIVKFHYSSAGREYTSDKFTIGYQGFSDYAKAQRLVERYPPDSSATCYANSKNPAEAVLERSSLWVVFGLLFPIPFILIGACGIYLLWRGGKSESDVPSVRKPIPETVTICRSAKGN
jgi:hypothetical protein